MTDLVKRLKRLAQDATPAPWGKGMTTHHTVGPASDGYKDGYPVATFKHASDAELVDVLRNNLDTIISALSGIEGMGWRSIETAPEDGSLILGFQSTPGDHENRMAVCWRYGNPGATFWIGDGGLMPTHWMPLPKAPSLTSSPIKEGV